MDTTQLKANDIAQTDGASSWLTTLPIKDENFSLNRREFMDAICLRYNWSISRLPTICACSHNNSVEHALSCKLGGFISLRHNELRDLTAELLTEICKDVSKEPALSNLTDTEEELRADVSARGLWQPMQRAFIDVRVFHPFAPSYRNQSVSATFKSMENEKKRKYNRRIIERENGTFTPLIFTSNGGMSRETSIFFSRIAEMICEKRNCTKGEVSIWLKRKIMFSLIRSAVICLRGSRSRRKFAPIDESDIRISNASFN